MEKIDFVRLEGKIEDFQKYQKGMEFLFMIDAFCPILYNNTDIIEK